MHFVSRVFRLGLLPWAGLLVLVLAVVLMLAAPVARLPYKNCH